MRIFIAALVATVAATNSAFAHALLDRANPPVGSTVAQAPRELVLTFTGQLEPAFSNAEVRDEKGVIVSGKASVDGGSRLRVPLTALAPGAYKVKWRVLSVDTHRTEGNFTFRVGP